MIDAHLDRDVDLDAWRDRHHHQAPEDPRLHAGIATAGGIALSLQHGM